MTRSCFTSLALTGAALGLAGCQCNPSHFKTNLSDQRLLREVDALFPRPMTPDERREALLQARLEEHITGLLTATNDDCSLVYIPVTIPECELMSSWESAQGVLVAFDDAGNRTTVQRVTSSLWFKPDFERPWYCADGRKFSDPISLTPLSRWETMP